MRHRPRSARSRKLLAPLVLTLLVTTILFAQSAFAAACSKKNPCTAVFVTGPADAALNGNPTSENITSAPYTPGGAPVQVEVRDAAGALRGGVSITLRLSTNSTSASLSGPITATSNDLGLATFVGTEGNPITIDKVGLGYTMTTAGSNVSPAPPSGPFDIFMEGEICSGQCSVRDNISDPKVGATVASPPGQLGVLVQPLDVDCASTIPAGYKYLPLPTTSVIAWKFFDGTGAQIITADIAKSLAKQVLDRGSSHLDVCFQADPLKPAFTDKFGNVVSAGLPGLLSDCNSVITQNCIISETASGGGGRLITFTVNDGKGRI
jgi:hypothetical protein